VHVITGGHNTKILTQGPAKTKIEWLSSRVSHCTTCLFYQDTPGGMILTDVISDSMNV
jgi:hypothetical protein